MVDKGVAIAKRSDTRVTIYDVAKAAHVATSTVSRALNRPGRTNPYTQAHVQKIALELGYIEDKDFWCQPKALTGCIAVVFDNFNVDLILAMNTAASGLGYHLMLIDGAKPLGDLITSCRRISAQVDGFVLGDIKTNLEFEAFMQTQHVVRINCESKAGDAVIPDVGEGMRKLLGHLRGLGHQYFTYLYCQGRGWLSDTCLRAATQISRSLNMEMHVVEGMDNTLSAGNRAVKTWKKWLDSAVISYGNNAAIGFIQALDRAGVEVPEYVSVVGIGDSYSGSLSTPSLTTLEIPYTQITINAVKQLAKRIQKNSDAPQKIKKVPLKLISRDSVGVFW